MRSKLLYLLIVFVLTACNYNQNKSARIILNSDQFIIDENFSGCFASGKNRLTIDRKNKTILYCHDDYQNEKRIRKCDNYVLDSEKEAVIREFIFKGINDKRSSGCTNHTEYYIGTNFTKINFADDACELDGYIPMLTK